MRMQAPAHVSEKYHVSDAKRDRRLCSAGTSLHAEELVAVRKVDHILPWSLQHPAACSAGGACITVLLAIAAAAASTEMEKVRH